MSVQQDIGAQIASAAAKTAPPAAVAITSAAGWAWPTIVQVAAFGWIVLQASYLIWRWQRDWRKRP